MITDDEIKGCFARNPIIRPLMPLRTGGPLVLSVSLALPAGTSTNEQVSDSPADCQLLPIIAHAIGTGVSFKAGFAEGVMLVRRNASSIPCVLVGTIDDDATRVHVAITFYEQGRYCGEGAFDLALGAPCICTEQIQPRAECGARDALMSGCPDTRVSSTPNTCLPSDRG